jgi:O-antigen/teichoic acid export membrane protein
VHDRLIRRNVLVSLAGRSYVAVLHLLCIPLLLSLLGPESLGLLGLVAVIQGVLFVFDTGLSGVVSRELGRAHERPDTLAEARGKVRAIERAYLATAGAFGVIAGLLSIGFARNWMSEGSGLSTEVLTGCVLFLSIALAAQWMIGFYSAVLFGVHRASRAALVNAVLWTSRLLAGTAVAYMSDGSSMMFFAWYATSSLLAVALAATLAARSLGEVVEPKHSTVNALRQLARPIVAVSSVSIVLMVINQIDKVVFGLRFSLTDFGYYSLVWQIAGALYLVYGPIYSIYLPILAGHAAIGRLSEMRRSVSAGILTTTLILIPIVATTIVLSQTVLFAWTGSLEAAMRASQWLSLAVAGAFMGSVLLVPYAAQQALLRTDLTLMPAIVILFILLIAVGVAAALGSSTGIVAAWAACTAGLVAYSVTATLREIGESRRLRWWWEHVILPALLSLLVAIAVRHKWMDDMMDSRILAAGILLVTVCISAMVVAVSSPLARQFVRSWGLPGGTR